MDLNNFFKKWARFLIGCGLLASFTLALSACNTVEGIGRDVQGAGSAIERSADRTR